MTTLTLHDLDKIITEATAAAKVAAQTYFNEKLGGEDKYACGFAWVNLTHFEGERIKGNTKMGRLLKKAGVDQNWARTFEIWNPSGMHCQNIDTKEVGARAAADVFAKYGFSAYAGSRMD